MRQSVRHDAGMTLLEVVIAAAIFSIGSLGVLSLTLLSIQFNQNARYVIEANLLAQWKAEQMVLTANRDDSCTTTAACWSDGVTPTTEVSTVRLADIGEHEETSARYQLRWSFTDDVDAGGVSMTAVHIEVRWPRDRNKLGLDVGDTDFINCWEAGASCSTVTLDSLL